MRTDAVVPTLDELDDEIRGHMALSVKERIERGEDPESARYAALREFGNVTLMRESMRGVWRPRWVESLEALGHDIRIALRSLRHAKGLSITVALTLALGIGANAAIFSVVRQVLLRPLVNRDEDRLIYIRQSASGLGAKNTAFSMPEINDLRSRATTISAFGDFSVIDFTLVGLGEPRVVQAGVVSGSYFDVMGLRPVLGRLLNESDDGPKAAGAAVLTHRFWMASLKSDPSVIGKTIRLGSRQATIVGVLEPSIPYPADTDIIANIVTSPHHLDAVMVMQRTHRMTELFGRLAPGVTIDDARRELTAAHAAMMRAHPEAFSPNANPQLSVTLLRDQITARARPVLLVLLAAAAIVFAIACSNVANLILARTVRRERELSVRAALGASAGALRRTLLAESLVLCGSGAVLGVLLAPPMVTLVARYAARFSVRAVGVTVDPSLLWVGASLAIVAAIVLAFVPKLPAAQPSVATAVPIGGLRTTPRATSKLRAFAIAQIALSFVLLAGAAMILTTLIALQTARTGFDMGQVLALDVPVPLEAGGTYADLYQQIAQRVRMLPGVDQAAIGSFVPWRDVSSLLPTFPFAGEGSVLATGEANPRARLRAVGSQFFSTMGVPLLAGREFTDDDSRGNELVVIVNQGIAQRLFPNGDALNRHIWWTEPLFGKPEPRRIVGVVADVDDENVVAREALTIYHPFQQMPAASRVFVRATGDPYALVAPVTRIVRALSANQPVERAATLADVRAQVLAPERLNAFVFSGFAGIALLIAVVGVAGVLAFSVSARTREFGVRLAVGSTPRHLLRRVLSEGALIACIGILAGAIGGYAIATVTARYIESIRLPGVVPLVGAALVLMSAAVIASLMPAARASRVDVLQALRSE
jgi:putative ABC transport system permease protein